MGRYDTLKADTQDMILAIIPATAKRFGIAPENFKDVIPEDIRMRAWDCDRRDHIKDVTEDDPRNWGVQFLRDLSAIARHNEGNLAEFQQKLRAKVAKHTEKHPWARLEDIRAIRVNYEKPGLDSEEEKDPKALRPDYDEPQEEEEEFFELRDTSDHSGAKRGRNEVYEAVLQTYKGSKNNKRLKRDPNGSSWVRPESKSAPSKAKQPVPTVSSAVRARSLHPAVRTPTPLDRHSSSSAQRTSTPRKHGHGNRAHSLAPDLHRHESIPGDIETALAPDSPMPSIAEDPDNNSFDGRMMQANHHITEYSDNDNNDTLMMQSPNDSDDFSDSEDPELQRTAALLQVAEAQLRRDRLKLKYWNARVKAKQAKDAKDAQMATPSIEVGSQARRSISGLDRQYDVRQNGLYLDSQARRRVSSNQQNAFGNSPFSMQDNSYHSTPRNSIPPGNTSSNGLRGFSAMPQESLQDFGREAIGEPVGEVAQKPIGEPVQETIGDDIQELLQERIRKSSYVAAVETAPQEIPEEDQDYENSGDSDSDDSGTSTDNSNSNSDNSNDDDDEDEDENDEAEKVDGMDIDSDEELRAGDHDE